MYAATRSKEEKTREISMIEMSNTVVYPRAVMIHLHYTPVTHAHTESTSKFITKLSIMARTN